MKKKILLFLVLVVVSISGFGVFSYFKYPNKIDPNVSCIAQYDPVKARHPYLFFIHNNFSNACSVPHGWKIDDLKPNSEKFSGVITKFKTDCAFDGECSIFVGDQEVVVIAGDFMERPTIGTSEINSFDDTKLGSKVDVYAKKIGPNKHTLMGNSHYYIKFSK